MPIAVYNFGRVTVIRYLRNRRIQTVISISEKALNFELIARTAKLFTQFPALLPVYICTKACFNIGESALTRFYSAPTLVLHVVAVVLLLNYVMIRKK